MENPIVTLDENNFQNLYFRNSVSYSVFGRFGDFEVFQKNKSDFQTKTSEKSSTSNLHVIHEHAALKYFSNVLA